jgi:hypothetical protein
MIVAARAVVGFDAKELHPALERARAVLTAAVEPGPAPRVELLIGTLRGRALLEDLACTLAPDATGFRGKPGAPALTASEFLATLAEGPFAQFHGPLPMAPSAALALVERLWRDHRRALPTLALTLMGVRWQGAPPEAEGSLEVIALRGAKPRAPTLGASLVTHAPSRRDPHLQELLTRLSHSSGLEFKVVDASPEPADELRDEQRVALQVCLREALGSTQRELANVLPPIGSSPHLHHDTSSAFDERMRAVTAGRAEKVNVDSGFRRLMKARFPALRSRHGSGSLVFSRPITDRLELAVSFVKVHQWGLGKSFQVLLGLLDAHVETDYPWPLVEEDLLTVYGEWPPTNRAHTWAFSGAAQLDAALRGVGDVLEIALPAIEKALMTLVEPLPDGIPECVQRWAPVDWRGAVDLARTVREGWHDARLYGLSRWEEQPLPSHASVGVRTWCVQFRTGRTRLDVALPERGPVRWHMLKLGEGWPDEWLVGEHLRAERAIETAIDHRAGKSRPHEPTYLAFEDRRVPEPRWVIGFAPTRDEPEPKVLVDSRTGAVLTGTPLGPGEL